LIKPQNIQLAVGVEENFGFATLLLFGGQSGGFTQPVAGGFPDPNRAATAEGMMPQLSKNEDFYTCRFMKSTCASMDLVPVLGNSHVSSQGYTVVYLQWLLRHGAAVDRRPILLFPPGQVSLGRSEVTPFGFCFLTLKIIGL